MRRVLVAVDETTASHRAAEFADRFFGDDERFSLAAVNVAQVPMDAVPSIPYAGVAAWPHGPAANREAVDELMAQEEARSERVAREQMPENAQVEVVFGEPVDAIIQTAERHDVDLIVIGSRNRGLVEQLFSRSVSQDLARRAPKPVLVVP